nr:MAP kinase kinase kinase mkh1 [Ipomoea trifida]
MAVSDVEAVLEFLRKNGFTDSESALTEEIMERSQLGSFDYQSFLFPMVPPPPPLKIPATRRPEEVSGAGSCSHSSDDEEFVSLGSSTTELCSSEFTNPYGIRGDTCLSSQASSDRMSQFGTARDYHDFDMQNDLFWYREKDEDYAMPPDFGGSDFAAGPSEDKFVMTLDSGKQSAADVLSLDCEFEAHPLTSVDNNRDAKDETSKDYCHFDKSLQTRGGDDGKCGRDCADYSCSSPLCACCCGAGVVYRGDPAEYGIVDLKLTDINDLLDEQSGERDTEFRISDSIKKNSPHDWAGDLESTPHLRSPVIDKDCYPFIDVDDFEYKDDKPKAGEPYEPDAAPDEEGGTASDELLMLNASEDDFEVFNLRIIHRKNRTGFEESKDFPIVLNSIVAGRYHITEYLGSAAFSKVVQAHDLHMGVDVCLKIIKNDKDFFDQSLDEIKLLKYVNKHDPGDERHILRLYDYFYHQEHLFIVCELLRADLYEFQKYNRESGCEPYFTMLRLKTITRQCLVALEYLHGLGIIHCDLKPENILIKSYRRCEIKVIDLGSSCFQTDSLSLYVQSRSYRAPEVILGLHYDQRIDIWSLGCVLAELCSGEVLFPNEEIPMLLARVIGVLGPIDMDMLLEGQETHKYFTKEYDLYHINEDTNQLEYIIPEETSLEDQLQVSDPLFIDFVRKLLQINPITRPTATEALEHPWLS